MSQRSIELAGVLTRAVAPFCERDNSIWAASDDGRIVTCRLLDQRLTVRGDGYVDVVAVALSWHGLGVLVVQADGLVLEAERLDASRASARVVADLARPLAGACVDTSAEAVIVLESGPEARLQRLALTDGSVSPVSTVLPDPIAMTRLDAGRVACLHATADGTRLSTIALADGELTPGPLVAGSVLVGAEGGAEVIVADAAGVLTSVDVATAAITPGPAVGAPVRALARWGSLVLALTSETIEAIEWRLDEGVLPLDMPLGPAYAGGYLTVAADGAAAGLPAGALTFDIEEGMPFGSVSAGIEPPGPGGALRVRVLAGWTPGEYHLVARAIDTNAVVGRGRVRVTRQWPPELDGPAVAVTGKLDQPLAWGGGPTGPQNVRLTPAPEYLRVAIVAVDTQHRRLPDLPAVQRQWLRYITGAGAPAVTTLRRYIEEVSFRNTPRGAGGPTGTTVDVTLGKALGPVSVGGWGEVFEYFRPKDPDVWGGWGPTEDAKKTIFPGAFCDWLEAQPKVRDGDGIPQSIAGAVLRGIDAVVFVVQTASEQQFVAGGKQLGRAMYVWPQAWAGDFHWHTQHPDGPVTHSQKSIPTIYMPTHLPAMSPGNPIAPYDPANVLCHEIGHALGCEDLYDGLGVWNQRVSERTAGGADIMAGGNDLAHPSLANRLRFGWVDPAWLRTFDFGANPNGATVVLQSIETLARSGPRPGRSAGIEVRIRDGRNYYFEFRRTQPGQLGDQNLAGRFGGPSVLIGTDVVSKRVADDPARPDILLLPKDADMDGPALTTANTDYEESDVTDREHMHDFRVVYQGAEPGDPEAARVRVEYVRANRAELQIQAAKGGGDWKSPDIDLKGPAGMNTVAKGLEHTVVVRVRNAGTFKAESVRVALAWLPFTTSPGTWTPLPDPPRKDIAPRSDVLFETKWTPPASLQINGLDVEHFCVSAVVERYRDPRTPDHDEIVVDNNRAQSNFATAAARSGSPAERATSAVVLTNPLGHAATYLNVIEQTHEDFRAYVSNAWLRLGPGETRAVQVAYESLAGDPLRGEDFARRFERIAGDPNRLSLTSLLVSPGCSFPITRSGLSLLVRAGHRTDIRRLEWAGDGVRGTVSGTADDVTTPLEFGTVAVVLWAGRRPDEQLQTSGALGPDGVFLALAPPEMIAAARDGEELFAEALFLGGGLWAPSRSRARRLT